MRNVFVTLSLCFFSCTAFAHPGGHSLVCKTPANAKEKMEFSLGRSNGPGWYPAGYSLTVNGKKHEFTTDDEMKMLGSTFHNSPLGVILVTADNTEEDKEGNHTGYFSVVAIPSTVKAYDDQGKRVKWTLENERNECGDAAGKAVFKGILKGYFRDGADSKDNIEGEIMDCELSYNSGMAC